MKRLAIYLFYDKDGIVDDYIPYFLERFKPFTQKLWIVVNGSLTEEGRKALTPFADNILVRENSGFDAWSYKYALETYGFDKLSEFDEIILCNYTFYGPFWPLEKLFADMDKKECDWWSLFKWYEKYPIEYQHIPSFWTAYRKSLLASKDFKAFWDTLHAVNSYADSTLYYEQRQAPYYDKKGYKSAAWIDHRPYRKIWYDHWPMTGADRLVTQDKCPFIKRRCFFVEDGQIRFARAVKNTLAFLHKHSTYDTNLILQNLRRTQDIDSLERKKNLLFFIKSLRYFLSKTLHPRAKERRRYALKEAALRLDKQAFLNLFKKPEGEEK